MVPIFVLQIYYVNTLFPFLKSTFLEVQSVLNLKAPFSISNNIPQINLNVITSYI